MRFAFIAANRSEFLIILMCKVLNVSVSGYYAWMKRPESERALANTELRERIAEVYKRNRKVYGSPRITKALEQEGVPCGENRVARLMVEAGITADQKPKFKPQSTDSVHDLPIARNILDQDFTATQPNQKWVADITYIGTQEGWLYLAVVLDLYSRMIVGWSMSEHPNSELVTAAMKMATTARPAAAGVIVHSDRGSQYASGQHREMLEACGFLQSMSGRGNCYDNAAMESWFSTLKRECANAKEEFTSRSAARLEIFDYIETFYNRTRLHSTLGYRSPVQFEAMAYIN